MSLSALLTLNLQGNLIEEIEDFSFLGLVSLTTLDLSHNNILTLADESLAGLPTMETLFLSHNHLQVVSGLWLVGTPLLRELLVMDNDITNVEEDAFAGLKNIQEINLARNPLSCDCHMSSFHSFLISTPSLSNSTLLSSLCSTPVYLTNTPLYQLPLPLDCEETATPIPGDYYEYYTVNHQEGSGKFLSSSDIHLLHSEYNQSSHHLDLVWSVQEAAIPYKCGQLHVFEESDSEGVVLVTHDTLACDDDKQDKILITSLNLKKYGLTINKPYIICISLVQNQSVIPGCSGSLSVTNHDQVSVHSLEEQSSITSLHANVTMDHSVSIFLHTRVPSTMVHACKVHVSVGLPVSPPTVLSLRTFNCSVSKYVLTDIPLHNYFNICAVLQVEESQPNKQEVLDLLSHSGQCMIVSTPSIRYHTRSVQPLLLTLIFLSIGIACLTVLYFIIKWCIQDNKQPPHRQPSISPLLIFCWRVRNKAGGQHECLAEDVDDDDL